MGTFTIHYSSPLDHISSQCYQAVKDFIDKKTKKQTKKTQQRKKLGDSCKCLGIGDLAPGISLALSLNIYPPSLAIL